MKLSKRETANLAAVQRLLEMRVVPDLEKIRLRLKKDGFIVEAGQSEIVTGSAIHIALVLQRRLDSAEKVKAA